MKINQFNISPEMSVQKKNLPEWTWDDNIKIGLKAAKIFSCENSKLKYKELYWFAQKNMNELMATFV